MNNHLSKIALAIILFGFAATFASYLVSKQDEDVSETPCIILHSRTHGFPWGYYNDEGYNTGQCDILINLPPESHYSKFILDNIFWSIFGLGAAVMLKKNRSARI
jgi:hypothetical protein